MKKVIKHNHLITISPLALLALSACGGGSGQDSSSGSSAQTITGNIVKGPLNNALVFLDYNGNGTLDGSETSVRTDANGAFSLSATGSNYTIVALTDETTVDTSSGAVLDGVTLKAPSGASVVTPTTTLMEEGDLTAAQVAEVLNLPDGVDPLTFNPFAAGVDAADALAVEKVSQQIMTAVSSFASAAEGAGASEADAFTAALGSVIEVVKVKAENLSDENASVADKTLDFSSASDLNLIKAEVTGKTTNLSGIDADAVSALIDDTATSIKNVNDEIAKVTDLTSDATKATFSTMQVLIEEVKEAATAEAASAGSGSIAFTDASTVEAAATNKAPTDITLSASSISEGASSLVIGKATTTDTDQTDDVAFKYSIVAAEGTDHDAFTINSETGELSLKAQPDYETKSSYKVKIQSTDEFERSYQKEFEIEVLDFSQTIIVFDSFGYETAKLSNVELFDYEATYEAGWQSYTIDSFDQFTYLIEDTYNPENFKGFTALSIIPDNLEGQRIYTDEFTEVADWAKISATDIYRYEGDDTIDNDEKFDYVYDINTSTGAEYAYLDDLDGIDEVPWIPQAEAKGIYVSYFEIIPDVDGETPFSYLNMGGTQSFVDTDPLADFTLLDWQDNESVVQSSQNFFYVDNNEDARLAWATERNNFETMHGDVVVSEIINQIEQHLLDDISIVAVDILGEDQSDYYELFNFSNDTEYVESENGFNQLFDEIKKLDLEEINFANLSFVSGNRQALINNLEGEGILSFAALPNDDIYGSRYWDYGWGSDTNLTANIAIDVAGSEQVGSAYPASIPFADIFETNSAETEEDWFGTSFATPEALGKIIQKIASFNTSDFEKYLKDTKIDIDEASEILGFTKSSTTYSEPNKKALFFEHADSVFNSTDYDFAILDSDAGSLELFIENFDFWDKLTEDVKAGASTTKLAIGLSNIPTENENHISIFDDYSNFIDVSSVTAEDKVYGTVLTVSDEKLLEENIETAFGITAQAIDANDYIGFYIMTDNFGAGEDFLLEDMFLV